MKPIPQIFQTLYAELVQRSLDASFSADFAVEGRFVAVEVRGRKYWYFDTPGEEGRKNRRYVGPVSDIEITKRVEDFNNIKEDFRSRRRLVSTLIREAYLPSPTPIVGDIVKALSDAGFFRLRGVLVGTVAFQCYAGLIGVRLPNTALQTDDADFAQFHSISVAVQDQLPPVLDVLRAVDPTFREVPHQLDGRFASQFMARSGYKVEFLTPNIGPSEHARRPAHMPALGGAAAQPLRFLDFLIYQPVRAVLLHKDGVPVTIPAPERFAVHKLIIGSRRRKEGSSVAKSAKDRLQAQTMLEVMISLRQHVALADAYVEAWDRGPAWRKAIQESLTTFEADAWDRITSGLANGVRELDRDPADYGLTDAPSDRDRPTGPAAPR